ncbi:MAG TPA: creatininase family protein [Feifaniaceae bacterium]|nr:creatininase family protein [Feifaniaceae bacterium]
MLTYDMSADQIIKKDPGLAILPIASIEQHGPHLPVSTDWYIATALGQGLAEATGGFLIPALPLSTCREHMGKKGAVWIDPDVFYDMVMSIFKSLKEQGFQRVATLQCHGGVFIMTPIIRQTNATCNPDFMAVNIDVCNLFAAFYQEGIAETSTELHAGEIETSLMLHIKPETVNMDLAVDFIPSVPRSYLSYGSVFRASESGVWGEPTKASAEKGARMLSRGIELAAKEMNEAFSYMQAKQKFGYSNF